MTSPVFGGSQTASFVDAILDPSKVQNGASMVVTKLANQQLTPRRWRINQNDKCVLQIRTDVRSMVL